jgi:hypothetical protein
VFIDGLTPMKETCAFFVNHHNYKVPKNKYLPHYIEIGLNTITLKSLEMEAIYSMFPYNINER